MEYTTVLGVDKKHLRQLQLVWPSWLEHKPSLLDNPLIIFHDDSITSLDISDTLHSPYPSITAVVSWPQPKDIEYPVGDTRWNDQQRYKMLSGFVHVPAQMVKTEYWLKLDLDTVATGMDDWIDEKWFDGSPAIVAHPWGYTKPANQMVLLDQWMEKSKIEGFCHNDPLNLVPKPDSSSIGHKRIISWCSFFHTGFTRLCSEAAEATCGLGMLPVPSQDGYLWYMAKRGNLGIKRENMKSRGWRHESTIRGIMKALEEKDEWVKS